MKTRAAIKLLVLAGAFVSWRAAMAEGAVDHYVFSPVTSPGRVAVPLNVTVSARDASGVLVTNFSGPVQLFFTNNATPVYLNDFSGGFAFDTDGDGTTDGAEWRMISGTGVYYGTYGFNLQSNTVYTLSLDQAINPGGFLYYGPDAVLYFENYPAQIGYGWGGWVPGGQTSRFRPYIEFGSMGEGAHMLMLRYWLPLGGSTSIYTDNLKVRVRDVSPGFVSFQNGEWTGPLTVYYTGTNMVLRALDNHGRSGDSNPFDILPRAADVSVTMLPRSFLPVGETVWISFQVSNAGPSSIEGVIVTNEIPANMTLIQTDPYGGTMVDGNHVVTPLSIIPGGEALTFSLLVQRTNAGVAAITATLGTPDYDTNPLNQTASGSVTFVPVLTGTDVTVTETPGGTNAIFQFAINATNTQDLAVNYVVSPISATPGTDYSPLPPGTLVFSAGSTQQSLTIPIADDVFYESDEQFLVTLSVTNGTPLVLNATNFMGTIISDDSLPMLIVTTPAQESEAAGTLTNAGSFSVSAQFEEDLLLAITSSNPARILSPGPILLPAGQTNALFNLVMVDDQVWNPTQTVTINVACTNGMNGSAPISVINEDLPGLTVTLSFKPAEGGTPVSSGLRVTIPFALSTNLTIALQSSDTTEMVLPGLAIVTAGATFTNVSPTVVDDTETDGPQNVTLTAIAPGFKMGTLTVSVSDNDLHHFVIRSEQSESIHNQTSTVPFGIFITAKDLGSNTLSGFSQAVALSATSDLGPVQLTPAMTTPFSRGAWFGSVTISNGDFTNVRIVATETNAAAHSGTSAPFRVFASPAQQLRILGATIAGPDVQVRFNSVSGRNYRLEASPESATAPWNVVVPSITGLGGAMTVTNSGGSAAPRGFYRVVLQP